jgi:hypothetical protein
MLAAVRDFEQLDSLNDLVALASPAGVHA